MQLPGRHATRVAAVVCNTVAAETTHSGSSAASGNRVAIDVEEHRRRRRTSTGGDRRTSSAAEVVVGTTSAGSGVGDRRVWPGVDGKSGVGSALPRHHRCGCGLDGHVVEVYCCSVGGRRGLVGAADTATTATGFIDGAAGKPARRGAVVR